MLDRRPLLMVALAALFSLVGCAGTHMAQPVEMRTGTRISSATITLDESAAATMPVQVTKTAGAYGYAPPKPTITGPEKEQAVKRAKAVLDAYRSHAQRMLRSKLAAEGVAEGGQTEVALRPQWVSVNSYNGSVTVAVEVVVRQREAVGVWKTTAISNNLADAPYWSLARAPGIGDEADVDLAKLVDSFSSAAVRAMAQAGWFR